MGEYWYEDLGFEEDPFRPRPDLDYPRVGLTDEKVEEILYRVHSGSMIFIEGNFGRWLLSQAIIDRFQGQQRLVYINCKLLKGDLDIETIVDERQRHFKEALGMQTRELILVLNNVHELSAEVMEDIKYFFDENVIESVIFIGPSYEKTNLNESIRSRIGNRKIQLKPLTFFDCTELLDERLDGENIFTEKALELLFHYSQEDPEEFLLNCRDMCEDLIDVEFQEITEEDVEDYFAEDAEEEDPLLNE